ncbi:MAG: peptidase, partial [Gemmatimonadetes bacterium]|nr:peptidase [Gemmatimonadota bacterium]
MGFPCRRVQHARRHFLKFTVMRLLILLHRYLGIAVGLVVSLWCLSGFVMMYVQFPDLSREEQLQGLDELNLSECCSLPAEFSNLDLDHYRIEMMAGRPVLRLSADSEQYVIDLQQGEFLADISEQRAGEIATIFSANLGFAGDTHFLGTLDRDQWTVYGGLNPNRPLFHYQASDPAATEWYVSSINGEVIQMTTARERFWNWAGSVVHWIYPTILRQHTGAWLQVIIWLSVLGLFLTVVGVYIGITQLQNRRNGRLSPYRGVMLWHHYTGLIFGILTLTWLFSGLLSVNPWG